MFNYIGLTNHENENKTNYIENSITESLLDNNDQLKYDNNFLQKNKYYIIIVLFFTTIIMLLWLLYFFNII